MKKARGMQRTRQRERKIGEIPPISAMLKQVEHRLSSVQGVRRVIVFGNEEDGLGWVEEKVT